MIKELKTLEDVLAAVTPENVDCFLQDFGAWLHITMHVDAMNKKNGDVRVEQVNRGTFKWIDDGKNDIDIKLVEGGPAQLK